MCANVVVGLEEAIAITNQPKRCFGTAGPFPNLFAEAWREDEHVFSADGGNLQGNAGTQHLGSPGRVSPDVLNRHPVEVLAIKDAPPSDALSHDRFWVKWIEKCTVPHLPSYIIVAALPKELVEADGLQSKSWRRWFQAWGYEPHYWFLRSTEHGVVV